MLEEFLWHISREIFFTGSNGYAHFPLRFCFFPPDSQEEDVFSHHTLPHSVLVLVWPDCHKACYGFCTCALTVGLHQTALPKGNHLHHNCEQVQLLLWHTENCYSTQVALFLTWWQKSDVCFWPSGRPPMALSVPACSCACEHPWGCFLEMAVTLYGPVPLYASDPCYGFGISLLLLNILSSASWEHACLAPRVSQGIPWVPQVINHLFPFCWFQTNSQFIA